MGAKGRGFGSVSCTNGVSQGKKDPGPPVCLPQPCESAPHMQVSSSCSFPRREEGGEKKMDTAKGTQTKTVPSTWLCFSSGFSARVQEPSYECFSPRGGCVFTASWALCSRTLGWRTRRTVLVLSPASVCRPGPSSSSPPAPSNP